MSELTNPTESWVEVETRKPDGSLYMQQYVVDNTFEIEYEGVTRDYFVLIKPEDFGTGEDITPDLMRFDSITSELEEIIDEDEMAHVVDYIAKQYEVEHA